jgi:hypothetical protein
MILAEVALFLHFIFSKATLLSKPSAGLVETDSRFFWELFEGEMGGWSLQWRQENGK